MTTLKDLRDRSLAEQGKKPDLPPVDPLPKPEITASPEPVKTNVEQAYDQSYDHTVIRSYDHITGNISDSVQSPPVDIDAQAALEAMIQGMLATPARTVTFKLHIGIDDWINQYLADNWRTRPMKMAILAEALTDWIRKKELEKADM